MPFLILRRHLGKRLIITCWWTIPFIMKSTKSCHTFNNPRWKQRRHWEKNSPWTWKMNQKMLVVEEDGDEVHRAKKVENIFVWYGWQSAGYLHAKWRFVDPAIVDDSGLVWLCLKVCLPVKSAWCAPVATVHVIYTVENSTLKILFSLHCYLLVFWEHNPLSRISGISVFWETISMIGFALLRKLHPLEHWLTCRAWR
jgi:hypothetical protein